jgi:hypothetical protein
MQQLLACSRNRAGYDELANTVPTFVWDSARSVLVVTRGIKPMGFISSDWQCNVERNRFSLLFCNDMNDMIDRISLLFYNDMNDMIRLGTMNGWVTLELDPTEGEWANVEYGPIAFRILLQRIEALVPVLPAAQRAALVQFLQLAAQLI